MENSNVNKMEYSYTQKVLIAVGILFLGITIFLISKAIFNVFLLILAAALIALFFRGFSSIIERFTNWNSTLSLILSVLVTLLLVAGLFWLIGSKVQNQVSQLKETLPATIQKAKVELAKSSFGQEISNYLTSPETIQKAKSVASTFFNTTFGILGDIYVIFFIGIFLTVGPKEYVKGIVSLVPQSKRGNAHQLISKIGSNLQKWLKGKLFAMLVVFIFTAIGLKIIGMPMWLALALIAGLLNFIPNFGPLIAMIPAVLVALLQGTEMALWVAGLYILVQMVESNFITPAVQKKLIKISPALIIVAQLIVGTLAGFWGIILATPFMVILIIITQELYIKNIETK